MLENSVIETKQNETETQVYCAEEIQKTLALGKSKTYEYLAEV